jgi:hypothetical protein
MTALQEFAASRLTAFSQARVVVMVDHGADANSQFTAGDSSDDGLHAWNPVTIVINARVA